MGLTASMTYDATTGRMVQTTGIDGQVTQVSYTAQGDIASWSRAGRSVTTEQDMLGRTVLWKSNDGQSIRASYAGAKLETKAQPTYTLSIKDVQTGKLVSKEVSLTDGLKTMGVEQGQMIAMALPVAVVGAAEWCAVTPGCASTVVGGALRICASYATTIFQAIAAGYAYQIIDCAVNGTCATAAPTADSLTKAHDDAKGDATKPGYGGQCKPDDYKRREQTKINSCQGASGCTQSESSEIKLGKIQKLQQCIDARKDMMDSCFMGGDKAHQRAVQDERDKLNLCKGRF
jgi:hypothetical protein